MNNFHANSDEYPPMVAAICNITVEAQHYADDAPPGCVQEKFPHMHTFNIKCMKSVKHSEREVWPQAIRHQIKEWFVDNFRETTSGLPDLGNSSCAALAMWVLKQFHLDTCEVTEEGVAGALVQRRL